MHTPKDHPNDVDPVGCIVIIIVIVILGLLFR